MSAPRCRQCKQRSVWRYKNNDISACKRCYHQVWNTTRRRLRDYHAALGLLERGGIPETLRTYGSTVEDIARALLAELEGTAWHTGAKHEVPLLLTRCKRLTGQGGPHHADLG